MKRRVGFLKAKLYCVIGGYAEEVLSILFIAIGILLKEYIATLLVLMYIWFRKLYVIVKREGCLQIVKTGKRYQLSMCKSFPGKKQTTIFRCFLKSFQDIFDEKTLKKLRGKTVYINTHSIFC